MFKKRISLLGAVLALISLLAQAATAAQAAPMIFYQMQSVDGSFELIVYNKSITWNEASAICGASGKYLADILSKDENSIVTGLLSRARWPSGTYSGAWTGFNDKGTEGKWGWSSGQPVSYTNWGYDEPNNLLGGNEDCGAIELARNGNKDGWWNDAPCDGNLNHYPGVLCSSRPGPATFQFLKSRYFAYEGDGSVTVHVTCSGNNQGGVDYDTSDDTAKSGYDYTQIHGYLGQCRDTSIKIKIIDDWKIEKIETFIISLGNPIDGAKLGSPKTAEVRILDDDGNDCYEKGKIDEMAKLPKPKYPVCE